MSDQIAISVHDVYKSFKLPHEKHTGLKQAVINFRPGRKYQRQQVLQDVSFEVHKGEFFGIIGRNGSGKSTLLKLLAQTYTPEKGAVQIHGSLTPFIELGVGFNPELTGRENVYLNGALLGFDRKQMDGLYDSIVEFAELHEFMDQKLKNYSSGMQVRLAFSVAIRARSDILLIDEVLAVGDAAFQTKCFDYFYQLKKKGTTVVFVSHDLGSLERFCDRGILIDEGKITARGPIKKVLQSYGQVVLKELDEAGERDAGLKPRHDRPRSAEAAITNVATHDEHNKLKKKFVFGDAINVSYDISIKKPLLNPIFGVTVWQKNLNKPVVAVNTLIDGVKETGRFNPGETVSFQITLPKILNDGEYQVEPAIANESATTFYDQQPNAASFFIIGSPNPHSVISTPHKSKWGKKK